MTDLEQLKNKLANQIPENSFRLDARTAAMLLDSIKRYTQLIPFSGDEKQVWNNFWFAERTPEALATIYQDLLLAEKKLPVQQTFLLVLLRLLETPALLLNTLPARHRSFYYRELLGFIQKSSQPDGVVVSFTLQHAVSHYLLSAGTQLSAGQDNGGNNLYYLTDRDLLITRQQLTNLCWTRQDKDGSWKLCTAFDALNNVDLPAEGIRLFSATQKEEALNTTLSFARPLAELSGNVTLTAFWGKDNEHAFRPLLALADRPLPVQRDDEALTVWQLTDASARSGLRSAASTAPLSLRFPVGKRAALPASLSLEMADCQQIGYVAPGNQGHLNAFSYPFGLTPQAGNAFELRLPAAFSQTGGSLIIEPQWRDLPQENFASWYANYPDAPADNGLFRVQITLLNAEAEPLATQEQPLFSGNGTPQMQPLTVEIPAAEATTYRVRVTLLAGASYHAAWLADPAGKNVAWTPQVSRINTRFCQALPLPETPSAALKSATPRQTLYCGFSDVVAGETLSLYWSLASPAPLNLNWFYYNRLGKWSTLAAGLIDDTRGLFDSALWQAVLPDDAAYGSDVSSLGKDTLWIKGVVADEKAIPASDAPKLKAVIANAVTATLDSRSPVDDSHFAAPLPAGSVSQLVQPLAEIASVSQPLPSAGGKIAETESELFSRAAARLSHRQRAITWGDMRTLLKAHFPQIFDVQFPDIDKLSHLPALETQQLMVIPDTGSRDNDDVLRPTLSAARLAEMQTWLTHYTSVWASPQLVNPVYIDVTVRYQVIFVAGVNPDYGYQQLNDQLQQQYMPWGEDQRLAVKPGNQIDYFGLLVSLQQSALVERVVFLQLNRANQKPCQETIVAEDNQVFIVIPQPVGGNITGEAHV